MTRQVNQFRPKGDPTASPYAPQRDLANIFLPMLRETFASLDAANWNDFFKELFAAKGVTEEDLGKIVPKFAEAYRLFIRDRAVDSPMKAFEQAGITDADDTVKYALFCRLGEVVTGGFFIALRDVTMQGHESPCAADMASMLAAGRELAARLDGRLANYEVGEYETAVASLEEKLRVIHQLQTMLEQSQQEANRPPDPATVKLRGTIDALQKFRGFQRFGFWLTTCWRLLRGTL